MLEDDSADLAGQVWNWPSKAEMVSILRNAGLTVYVGKYSIRVENCSYFVFQEYGESLGGPSIEADADTAEEMMRDAELVSKAFAAASIKHRFVVSDGSGKQVGYFHYDWPQGKEA